MKFSKSMIWLGLIVFMAGFMACGGGEEGGKYAEAKQVMSKYSKLMDENLTKLEKAETGKEVAAALTAFGKAMQEMQVEMEKFTEKYPEFKDMENPPAELEKEAKEFEAIMERMGPAMSKIMQFMDDPDVQKAQEEFSKIR